MQIQPARYNWAWEKCNLGDTVSNILEWQGFKVTREYYFNNAGRQMRILGDSVERYFEILGKDFQFPKDGYQGDYIKDIAGDILKSMGEKIDGKDTIFTEYAEKVMFENIKIFKKLEDQF